MTQNHKCHLSRSSGGVGRKADDFQRRNLCYKTIASGFGSVEHLQIVAPAHDSCFSKRIFTGSDARWPNELLSDLGWIMTQNHKCHLSRSSGGVGWKADDFQRRNSCYKTIANGFGSVEHLQMVAPAHDSWVFETNLHPIWTTILAPGNIFSEIWSSLATLSELISVARGRIDLGSFLAQSSLSILYGKIYFK